MKDFKEYGLPNEVLASLEKQKIVSPLAVQASTAEKALSGANLLVQSPTGTGKTLAFLLPVLKKIKLDENNCQALIIMPTRELAGQLNNVLGIYKMPGLRQAMLIGGANKERQKEKLKKKPQIIIGTPGRIDEAMRVMKLNLDSVNMIVVDEADKLADEKFYNGVRDLLNQLPDDAQTLFFSATVTDDAQRMMRDIGRTFELILMSKKKTNEDILHQFIMAEDSRKFNLLLRLAEELKIKRAIVFITRNAGVKGLAGRMQEDGLKAQGIHSGLSSQDRKRIIGHFRSGKVDYLVTTDIFARGMDVPDVRYIINYDVPKDQTSYIHRSGRTARAGRKGTVITFVEERTKFVVGKLERNLDIEIREKGFTKDGKYIDVDY